LLRNYVALYIRGNVQYHTSFIQLVLMFNMYVTLHLKCLLTFLYKNRQIKFLIGLCHVDNIVLRFLFDVMDRNVLAELKLRYDS